MRSCRGRLAHVRGRAAPRCGGARGRGDRSRWIERGYDTTTSRECGPRGRLEGGLSLPPSAEPRKARPKRRTAVSIAGRRQLSPRAGSAPGGRPGWKPDRARAIGGGDHGLQAPVRLPPPPPPRAIGKPSAGRGEGVVACGGKGRHRGISTSSRIGASGGSRCGRRVGRARMLLRPPRLAHQSAARAALAR